MAHKNHDWNHYRKNANLLYRRVDPTVRKLIPKWDKERTITDAMIPSIVDNERLVHQLWKECAWWCWGSVTGDQVAELYQCFVRKLPKYNPERGIYRNFFSFTWFQWVADRRRKALEGKLAGIVRRVTDDNVIGSGHPDYDVIMESYACHFDQELGSESDWIDWSEEDS